MEPIPVGLEVSKTGPAIFVEGTYVAVTLTERDQIRGSDLYTAMLLREPVIVGPKDVYRPDGARAR